MSQEDGGSLEDLWPFNEEIVAEAIYNSEIPIISAVGHETDFTISDFVADLRAPTPSAAAELAVPDIEQIKNTLNSYNERMKISLKKKIEYKKLQYEKVKMSRVFKEPLQRINEEYMAIDTNVKLLENIINNKLKDDKTRLIEKVSKLEALSPLKTLIRGYIVAEKDNKIIKSVKDIQTKDIVNLNFNDGKINAQIL